MPGDEFRAQAGWVPSQVCPPLWITDLGGLSGSETTQRKRLTAGEAGPMLHFLCEFTVSPAPGTAITSLDCSCNPTESRFGSKAPSCYQKMAQEDSRNTKKLRCNLSQAEFRKALGPGGWEEERPCFKAKADPSALLPPGVAGPTPLPAATAWAPRPAGEDHDPGCW